MRTAALFIAIVGLVGAISGCKDRRSARADESTSSTSSTTESTPVAVATPVATTAAAATPSAAPPKEPLGEVTIGRVAVEGKVTEAELVVGSFKADFGDCYEKALAASPTVAGRVDIVVKVEPTGSIVGMPTDEHAIGLNPELVSCLTKAVSSARFRGFAGSRATIHVPLVLAPKKPK
jgi:hypothetical protein